MKLYYARLQFELTRRCNEICAHCCRGEQQNLNLTKETVDNFFEKNDIYAIGTLLFSGGEPTLNGELLEYIVDKIIKQKIKVDMFMMGINGKTYSEALINGLNKLKDYILKTSDYPKKFPGFLSISQDQFHEPANEEVIKKLSKLSYLSPIMKTEMPASVILPYGRAYENHLIDTEPDLTQLTDYQKNYHIKEYEGETYLVIAYQYIAANGNIINDGCASYDLMDKYSLGNVNNTKIEDIYTGDKPMKLQLK